MKHFNNTIQGWDDQIPEVYKERVLKANDNAHFVEVGCWKGRSSAFMAVEIINSEKKIKFDCVDTWEGDPNESAMTSDEYVMNGTLYEHFLENMKHVKGYFTAIRKPSVEAAKLYEDNSLDFVFIDAAHDYDNVKQDITAWWPKIKAGGILAGHDYGHSPVAKAVADSLQDFWVDHGCWFKLK